MQKDKEIENKSKNWRYKEWNVYMSNYILAHTKREKWDKDKNKIRLFQIDEKYQSSDLES